MKKIISFLLSGIIFANIGITPVLASSYEDSYKYNIEVVYENENVDDTQNSIAGVAIFVGGMLVAWIVDGTVEYVTGHTPSTWVRKGIEKALEIFRRNKNVSSIYVN